MLFDRSSVKMRITPEGKTVQMEAILLFEDIKHTVFTFHAGITIVKITAIWIKIDHLFEIRPPESVLPGEVLVVNYV